MQATKENQKNKAPRRYSDDEKRDYAHKAQGYESIAEAAREMGLNSSMLGRWVREYGKGRPGPDPRKGAVTQLKPAQEAQAAVSIVEQLEGQIFERENELNAMKTALEVLKKERVI